MKLDRDTALFLIADRLLQEAFAPDGCAVAKEAFSENGTPSLIELAKDMVEVFEFHSEYGNPERGFLGSVFDHIEEFVRDYKVPNHTGVLTISCTVDCDEQGNYNRNQAKLAMFSRLGNLTNDDWPELEDVNAEHP